MNQRLAIVVCNNLVAEVSHIIHTGDYPDVKVISYKALCLDGSHNCEKIAKQVESAGEKYAKVILFAGYCIPQSNAQNLKCRNLQIIRMEKCFELFIPKETIYHYVDQGYYIVTSGWLKQCRQHMKNWGFDKDQAKTFFKESLSKILWLDTSLPGDSISKMIELSAYMGLSYERLPVGLSYGKQLLDNTITNWRAENERIYINEQISRLSEESSDYSMIFSQLKNLVDYTDESEIITKIFELLNILFAPQQLCFHHYLNGIESEKTYYKSEENTRCLTEDDSFVIEILYANKRVGAFDVMGIQFPSHIPKYKKTSRVIGQMCGLAIANAQRYKTLQIQKEKLHELSQQLQESNATKDRFFSIISHDLRSPFSSLIGLSDVLYENFDDLEKNEMKNLIQSIRSVANNTFHLLENLLEWSKIHQDLKTPEIKAYNLKDLTEEVCSLFIGSPKKITIKNKVEKDISVLCNAEMTKTVIRNLLSNAIKFSPVYGLIEINACQHGSQVEIRIQDNGVGIPPEVIPNLFSIEKNISTKGTAGEKGSGLGLLLCRELIEKQGGTIGVESEEGKGSTFWFQLESSGT
ncbi:MAG: ATP-binding protein [Bacteroidales bacterium]|nr:ATP-binding protein [Bacteroidales bacterium]